MHSQSWAVPALTVHPAGQPCGTHGDTGTAQCQLPEKLASYLPASPSLIPELCFPTPQHHQDHRIPGWFGLERMLRIRPCHGRGHLPLSQVLQALSNLQPGHPNFPFHPEPGRSCRAVPLSPGTRRIPCSTSSGAATLAFLQQQLLTQQPKLL